VLFRSVCPARDRLIAIILEIRIMARYHAGEFRAFLAALSLSFFLLPPAVAHAKAPREIDASVDTALHDFKKNVKGANDYLKAAKGVLVMPDVKKVGFVVGEQWGEGALRVGGKTVDSYKMEVGSAGFQAGYQKANFIFIFMTQKAFDAFRASERHEVGVETGLTVVDESTPTMSLDTLKSKSSVVAFSFGKEGLMGG
jgi:lipid-binding SYLF domain-containing protein